MSDNPFIGVGFHAAGGVAHGSFYVPLKKVRAWAWESAWLVQGLAAWMVMPWLIAMIGFMLLITYVPIISLWLPHLLGY